MRLVNIRNVTEGSVLARPIINPFGKVLLQTGMTLSSTFIERLMFLGYDVLYIKDYRLEDVDPVISISGQTREVAYKTMQNISRYIENGAYDSLDVNDMQNAVQEMINDLLSSKDIVCNLTDIQGYDQYTYHHSVNATILGLVLGIASRYSESKLLELGMGILMHDVGKIMIPASILNKKEKLTDDEFAQIKKHAELGFSILSRNNDISLLSAHVAFQHHEKWDGSGYPRGLKGNEIHEYGKLAAVADVYEALTSKRVYRNVIERNVAYEYIVSQSAKHFDPQALEIFKRHVVIYPSGSGVVLSNGQRGNVVRQNPAFPNRPYVRVFYQGEEHLPGPIEYDLTEHPSLMILKVDNR